ncbi:MAG TPA: hypothetical protein VGD67_26815 [Pseudonocardiaceae bacterium]
MTATRSVEKLAAELRRALDEPATGLTFPELDRLIATAVDHVRSCDCPLMPHRHADHHRHPLPSDRVAAALHDLAVHDDPPLATRPACTGCGHAWPTPGALQADHHRTTAATGQPAQLNPTTCPRCGCPTRSHR